MEELKVIYLGGPTLIIEIDGRRLMTDPTLDPAGAFIRLNDDMSERKIAGPALLDPGHIDVVLLSHDQHFDNLDDAGRELMRKVDVTVTTAVGAERLDNYCIGLLPWQPFRFFGVSGTEIIITATPARHGPAGIEKITGEVIGFLISVAGKRPFQIYLTGDTTFYTGIAEVARRFNPSYVFIYAGAARPRGPFNVTMGTNDAIDTASEFPNATLVPLHAEGWSHYTEHSDDLREAFTILGIEKQLQILEPGITTILEI
jgi:L-ascorbate metabolism protein UlaG (beta-lactamase superfamily)